MNIKSIETKHITTNPFAGLCEIDGEFTPYYQCKITTAAEHMSAKGETAELAEQAAIELLKTREANKVDDAYSKFLASNGVYFIDC